MNIVMLSSDSKIFQKGRVYQRMLSYAGLVSSLTVLVYTKPGFSEIVEGNLRVVPTNSKFKMFYFWDFTRLAKTLHHVDLVTSQDPLFLGLVGRHLKKVFSAKLEIQIHTDLFSNYFSAAMKGLALMVLKSADKVRVVSARIQSSLSDEIRAKSYILPIAHDLEHFLRAPKSDYLRTAFGKDTFIFLMVCRLESEKRVGDVLELFSSIRVTYPHIRLAIVGDGSLRSSLEQKAVSLEGSVKFFGWQEDLVQFYTSADCFISFSDYEGFGVSMLEAAATRLPVITTDTGLAGEIIVSNNSGIVIPVQNIRALRSSMEWEINNPKTALLYSEVAYATVAEYSHRPYLHILQEHWNETVSVTSHP